MSVAELEAEVKEYRLQLETVAAGLQADPTNGELATLKTELEEVISLTESAISELRPEPSAAPASHAPSQADPSAKWSRENHPAFQPGYKRAGGGSGEPAAQEEEKQATYKVNDAVLAKWKSGDRGFYPAKISSITGSAAKPVYLVTFKGYNNTETLFAHEIKPVAQHAGQKRKADGAPAGGPPPPPPPPPAPAFDDAGVGAAAAPSAPPGVISAAATVDPALASQAKKPEPSRVGDGPPKPAKVPKKIRANKELESGKSKWQEFSAGNKGKMGKMMKKKSMFTTGDGVNARVGFTGSGQAMRKDQARTRHIYDEDKEDEY